MAIPTICLSYLGVGRKNSVGSTLVASGMSSVVTIQQVIKAAPGAEPDNTYFSSVDGFVAFNLSKSLMHTLGPYELQPTDSIYYGLSNPVVDLIYGATEISEYSNPYISEIALFDDPGPLFTDSLSQWTVAPVFQSINPCLFSTAPVHVTCMLSNQIIGWAISTDEGAFCKSIRSPSCAIKGQTDQLLSIYYPLEFDRSTPPQTGIQGLLASPPPNYIVEAIQKRFVADGWPIDLDSTLYPNGMPSVWMYVSPTVSVQDPNASAQFDIFSFISFGFMFITGLLIVVPGALDVYTDILVLKMIERQKAISAFNQEEEKRRLERVRQVEAVLRNSNN